MPSEPDVIALEAPGEDPPPNLLARPRGGVRRRLPAYEAHLDVAPAGLKGTLLMKQSHPEWGSERIHLMLLRSEGFQASATAVGRVLKGKATRPHRCRRIGTSRWCADLRGRGRNRCGSRTCSPSSSSARTGACTWWRSWTIAAGSWRLQNFLDASARPRYEESNSNSICLRHLNN